MKRTMVILGLLLYAASTTGPAVSARSHSSAPAIVAVSALEARARARVSSTARVALLPSSDAAFREIDLTDLAPTGEVPNYLRGLGSIPEAVGPLRDLVHAVVYEGRVAPEVKLEMGLRVAQVHGSPYVAAHVQRLLSRTERGRAALSTLRASDEAGLAKADALAVHYAEILTRDVNGVHDADFAAVRADYDDSEIVELTVTVCFFNFFTRYCEGLALPVEPWALEAAPPAAAVPVEKTIVPRVGLISDAEMSGVADLQAAAKSSAGSGLGIGIANSMRAMMRAPEAAGAWRRFGTAVRDKAVVERSTQLQVSFAVSYANGCRYCTIHQVVGLRRLGVDVAKLVEMKKDDGALTPREMAAVTFARKVTADPTSASQADYESLRTSFGERGALEVLLQTCTFAFINRFTDNLSLPSEDEAVKIYREVYGPQAY